MNGAIPMPMGMDKSAILVLLLREEYGYLPAPPVGRVSNPGYVGYHLRAGRHYFSREDWHLFLDYLENT